jgi:hypothetical protein
LYRTKLNYLHDVEPRHSSPLLLRSPLFAVAGTAQTNSQTTFGHLRQQRDALCFTETSAEVVRTAEAAVAAAIEQAAAERARGDCKELCRQREAEERARARGPAQSPGEPGGHRQRGSGRPRVKRELEQLIVRMAGENRDWGYDRIVGALANLGFAISDQTVVKASWAEAILPSRSTA